MIALTSLGKHDPPYHPFKHYIFERYPAVFADVELPDGFYHILQRINILNGHQTAAFLIERGVQANRKVAFAVFEKMPHGGNNTNG